MEKQHYFVAMYLRLSKEDFGEKENFSQRKSESNSIGTQREMILDFIRKQENLELYDVYVDDGFSGSNFERPEFKRMITDIKEGKVNCVIVKDLSRFGRDYIESGRYIQRIFPAFGVRFIAITDNYDSDTADDTISGIFLPVRNFINDSYCRDISIKVKSQLETKRKNGECVAPFAFYGYKKAENNKNQLVVDRYAAQIVKLIYQWKIKGFAVSAIAGKLNAFGILSPGEYKKSMGENFRGGFCVREKSQWSSTTVRRILTNELYLGHLIQGKTEKINYKLKKRILKEKETWVKVENTQEAIISESEFFIVQKLLETDGRVSPLTGDHNFFGGIIFCGDCKEQMIRRIHRYSNVSRTYYICSTKNRAEGCSRHSISEEKLKEILNQWIRSYTGWFLDIDRMIKNINHLNKNYHSFVIYKNEIQRMEKEKEKYKFFCTKLKEEEPKGIIAKEESKRLYNVFDKKIMDIAKSQKQQKRMVKELAKDCLTIQKRLKTIQENREMKETDRELLCFLVEEIKIFEGKRIEITFGVKDAFDPVIITKGGGKYREDFEKKSSGSKENV